MNRKERDSIVQAVSSLVIAEIKKTEIPSAPPVEKRWQTWLRTWGSLGGLAAIGLFVVQILGWQIGVDFNKKVQ